MAKKKLLVVDDEDSMRHMLQSMLSKEGYSVKVAANGEEAIKSIDEDVFDLMLCDIKMPGMDGLTLLKALMKRGISFPVIMMSAYGALDTAVEAIKEGAYDYISKPFNNDAILLTLKKAEERERLARENVRLRQEVEKSFSFENIIGKSSKMQELFNKIKKIANVKSTVLIMGESGTGKELVARAIHYNSGRKNEPFVAINCGAIPENLIESELFGHVKGAFTDAVSARRGLFEEAHGGTLFLDEIGELPLNLQVKLLRVLQESEIKRVGGTTTIKVDVRIVAATTRNLAEEVKEGRFRDDLFYRLNVLPMVLPPLRERMDDVPLLMNHFIHKFRDTLNLEVEGVDHDSLELILNYSWPGNVRELENAIERGMVMAEGKLIVADDLPADIKSKPTAESMQVDDGNLSIKKNCSAMEEKLIRKALEKTGGNRTKAAKLLEISHRALIYKIKDYNVEGKKTA
ncbi:MAG: sigma-54-dependent Fis family transcriptional regulator [Proteobacteria bacterium]|nr:sigma-54-dependent Fis family transcriptional regulator [Pseudomonadota bacterium]